MLLSRTTLFFLATFLLTVSARPTEKKRWGGWGGSWSGGGSHSSSWWQPAPVASFGDFGKRWGLGTGQCDMSSAVQNMNLGAATPPLPQPNPGLSLFQVVVGVGTQNYTCDLANSTAVPTPVGAVASLFDVSCVAATAKELLPVLATIALDLPIPSSSDPNSPIMTDMTGHHYFLDDTTPFFNLDTSLHSYGMGALQKANASDAPASAAAGPRGVGNGAVQWLKLDAKTEGEVQDSWKQVYRLDTAGGAAPALCVGEAPTLEIPYAAVYWLFT